eukprot:1554074-Pyramimonas_sp.AAC.1
MLILIHLDTFAHWWLVGNTHLQSRREVLSHLALFNLSARVYCLPSCDWFSRGVYTASPLAIGSYAEYILPPLLQLVLTLGIYCLQRAGAEGAVRACDGPPPRGRRGREQRSVLCERHHLAHDELGPPFQGEAPKDRTFAHE